MKCKLFLVALLLVGVTILGCGPTKRKYLIVQGQPGPQGAVGPQGPQGGQGNRAHKVIRVHKDHRVTSVQLAPLV